MPGAIEFEIDADGTVMVSGKTPKVHVPAPYQPIGLVRGRGSTNGPVSPPLPIAIVFVWRQSRAAFHMAHRCRSWVNSSPDGHRIGTAEVPPEADGIAAVGSFVPLADMRNIFIAARRVVACYMRGNAMKVAGNRALRSAYPSARSRSGGLGVYE